MERAFRFMLVLTVGFMVFASPAFATKKVYGPKVDKGELEFEVRSGYDFDHRSSNNSKFKQKYAIGYGINDWWFSEFYVVNEKTGGDDFEFVELEWENIFEFWEPGKYWVDAGLLTENKISFEKDKADKIEGKLLFEKTIDKFKNRTNLIFKKEIGGDTEKEIEAGFAWMTKYKWKEWLSPGFEYYIDFGELRESIPFKTQKHQVGPMFFGDILEREGSKVEYKIGYLFGTSDAAVDGALIFNLEYEMEF